MPPILAAVALLVLPIGLEGVLRRWPRLFARLDRLAAVGIVLLLVVEVLPGALAAAGLVGWVALAGGLVAPAVLERIGTPAGAVRGGAMLLAQGLLLVHAAFDGLALAAGGEDGSLVLPVLLHQVPVGLALWIAWRGRMGILGASVALLGVVGATVVGWAAGERWVVGVPPATLAWIQCVVSGSLVHMVGHGGWGRLPAPGLARPTRT